MISINKHYHKGEYDKVNKILDKLENDILIRQTSAYNNPCPADINEDGSVTTADLLFFLAAFGTICDNPCPADLNQDGSVTTADILQFLGAFGTNCE